MHDHVRPRDLLAVLGIPGAFVIGVLAASAPGLDPAVRATGITASLGAITSIVGYYFGRGEATSSAREANHMRNLWLAAQSEAMGNAAQLEKVVAVVAAQTGVDPDDAAQRNGADHAETSRE